MINLSSMENFMYILSQILVGVSDVFLIISMLSKNKRNIVINLILSTILFGFHYVCLSAFTGAFIAFFEIIFLIVIYLLDKYNKPKFNIYASIITILVTITISIFTWAGWISILPMLAMVVYLLAMLFTNIIIVKGGTFVRLALNGVYMFLIESYLGVALTLVVLGFTIYGIIRDNKCKQEEINSI